MGRKLDEDDVIHTMCQRIVGVSEVRARIIASHIPTAEPSASDCWSNDNKTTDDSIDTNSSRYGTDRTTDGLISEAEAIDALKICDNNEDGTNCHKCPLRDERWDGAWRDDETTCYTKLMRDSAKLLELPSTKPAPLTDKEKRIFLSAMGREEKVCKQVDEDYRDCREPYEDTLVSICREIVRKVKGTLWNEK